MGQAQVLMGIEEGPLEEWQRLTAMVAAPPTHASLLARYERGHDLRVQLGAAGSPQLLQDPTTADACRASRLRLARSQGMDAEGLVGLIERLCSHLPAGELGVETTRWVRAVEENLLADLLVGPSPQEHWPDVAETLRQRRLRRIAQVLRLHGMAHGPVPRPSRRTGEPHQVLVIGNQDIPQVYRYRQQKIVADLMAVGEDQLAVQNVDSWESLNSPTMGTRLLGVDLLVVCRLPATPRVLPLLLEARQQSIPIVVDVDDPIFDIEIFPPPLETYAGTINSDLHASMRADTANWLGVMRLADLVTTTTEPLRQSVIRCTGLEGARVRLHRNLMLPELIKESRRSRTGGSPGQPKLVYGTGTKAHKQIFLATVLPAMERLLEKHSNLRICVIGMAAEEGRSEGFGRLSIHPRMEWLPPTGYADYLRVLHDADISIAPLEISGATDCKSELKWFEAAMLGAAMVVSPTAAYRQLLQEGEDALFATDSNEWFQQLDLLVQDRPLRERIVAKAQEKALEVFAPTANQSSWKELLQAFSILQDRAEATAA
jgi:glycosyltransferase involved in cell wall biosynthesis